MQLPDAVAEKAFETGLAGGGTSSIPTSTTTKGGGGELGALLGGVSGLNALESIGDIIPGGGGPSEAYGGVLSNRTPIHIAPVGVNLGAIIAPFNQGGPENGGMGLDIASRFIQGATQARVTPLTAPPSTFPWKIVAVGAAGVGALFIFLKFRG